MGLIHPCVEYCSHVWGGSPCTRLFDRVEAKAFCLVRDVRLTSSLDSLSLMLIFLDEMWAALLCSPTTFHESVILNKQFGPQFCNDTIVGSTFLSQHNLVQHNSALHKVDTTISQHYWNKKCIVKTRYTIIVKMILL